MMTQQQLSDHIEITQLLQRYFHALDTRDYALLDSVFVPDARLHYDMGTATSASYAEMVPNFREFLKAFRFTQHVMSQPLIELGAAEDEPGRTARSTTTLRALHVQVDRNGAAVPWTVYGIYRDRLVHTQDGWRIDERRFKALEISGELLPPDRTRRFDPPTGDDTQKR